MTIGASVIHCGEDQKKGKISLELAPQVIAADWEPNEVKDAGDHLQCFSGFDSWRG
jgi:hypothetical protein